MWLNEPDRVNAILRPKPPSSATWHPQLADYGIRVERSKRGLYRRDDRPHDFRPAVEQTIRDRLHGLDVQPALTYLANSMAVGQDAQPGKAVRVGQAASTSACRRQARPEIPYSTITAIDFQDDRRLAPSCRSTVRPCPSWATTKSP